jgi:(p)ppGpp synthase/HD superfamily hydrolase
MHKELVYLKGFAKGKQYWQMLRAIQVAVELHEGQMRKAGGEYIEHPMSVTSELVALKLHDETLLASAILHDVIEDCNTSKSDLILAYGFNQDVGDTVSLLSKTKETVTSQYYAEISKNARAILIKVADRCHNISTMIGAFTVEKMKEYVEETEKYVIPLIKYGVNHYPEYSDELFVMRNHIESVTKCIKAFIESK